MKNIAFIIFVLSLLSAQPVIVAASRFDFDVYQKPILQRNINPSPAQTSSSKRRAVRSVSPFFVDADRDGYGDPAQSRNPYPDGSVDSAWVTNSNDCNDLDSNLFTVVSNLGQDDDQDRYYTGSLRSVCVGFGLFDGFAVWYSDGSHNYITAKTALGNNDSNDSDPRVH